jgi:starvation-inducible outer membrane lipoprotein
MFLLAQVSSMKTSLEGSRSSWLSNQASRRFTMSGQSCRMGGLFVQVTPWRAKKRHSAPMLKQCPRSASCA